MGNIDTITKDYMRKPEILSDAFNMLLYKGEQEQGRDREDQRERKIQKCTSYNYPVGIATVLKGILFDGGAFVLPSFGMTGMPVSGTCRTQEVLNKRIIFEVIKE